MNKKILSELKKRNNLIIVAIAIIGLVAITMGGKPTMAPEKPNNSGNESSSGENISTDVKNESENENGAENKTENPETDVQNPGNEKPIPADEAGKAFQKSTDADFSKVDPNMPKEVLDKIKDSYNKARTRLENYPYDFGANMDKAAALYNIGEFDKAITIYKKLGEMRPANFISFRALGDTYNQVKKFTEAESAYLTAIKNDSKDLQSYISLAFIYNYALKGDREKIIKFYEDGIENLGTNGYSLIKSYAEYLESLGEYAKSLEQWKIVSKEYPEDQAVKDKIAELEGKVR